MQFVWQIRHIPSQLFLAPQHAHSDLHKHGLVHQTYPELRFYIPRAYHPEDKIEDYEIVKFSLTEVKEDISTAIIPEPVFPYDIS